MCSVILTHAYLLLAGDLTINRKRRRMCLQSTKAWQRRPEGPVHGSAAELPGEGGLGTVPSADKSRSKPFNYHPGKLQNPRGRKRSQEATLSRDPNSSTHKAV